MKLSVPKERQTGETRVALVPEVVKQLVAKGFTVVVETGAGEQASIGDSEFTAAGATVSSDTRAVFGESDCVLKVAPPTSEEVGFLSDGKGLISFLWAGRNTETAAALTRKNTLAFAMDQIPRITRAQSMDALSSQATIAGYKAVLLAATTLPKFFPMLTTAAGTIRPAQALIIGAGVAGLQAIATARRLGAVVEAFDARPTVKEQVQSLGATFIEVKGQETAGTQDKYGYAQAASEELLTKQRALLAERIRVADFVVTTAQVPGKPAPRLISKEMCLAMKRGSVIIDLAAETGGNCELTQAGKTIHHPPVTIVGPVNLAATMPLDASRMYAKNIQALLGDIVKDGKFTMDWNNEVFRETSLNKKGPSA